MKDINKLRRIAHELLYILNKQEKKRFLISLVLIIVGSFFELLGVSAIIPFMQAITEPEGLASFPVLKPVFRVLHMNQSSNMLVVMTAIIILIYVVKNVFLIFSNRYQIWFRCQFQKDVSQRILEAYLKRPYEFFLETNSSKILRGISSDVLGVYNALQHISRILAELFTCIVIGVYFFYIDAFMAAGVSIIAFTVMLTITKISKPRLSRIGEELRVVSALQNKYAYQSIMGNKEIRVMRSTQSFVDSYAKASDTVKSVGVTYNVLLTIPERIIELSCISGIFLLACISYQLSGSTLFVEKLAAFAVAAFRILPSVSRITSDFNAVIFNIAPLRATYENLKEVEEYESQYQLEVLEKSEGKGEIVSPDYQFQDRIEARMLTWKYHNATDYVLYRTGFTIHKGESVGIIGASGSGKSTLTDILLGLLRPQEGAVEMDGIDILTIPEQWSKNVGYVPQTVFLTDDTIAGNIAFGVAESDIDESKVRKSLKQAMLSDFVKSLPEGIHTIVGERGVKLSGGQRQRIAIARALYYDPDIFVLDEATAALDNETEAELMQSIDSLQGIKTMIIVAHRLTTIKKCDKIYEVINGSIVERTKEEVFG